MFTLTSIQRKIDRLKQLEEQIHKQKEKIHSDLGKELIEQLDIDYSLLTNKKEIYDVIHLISSEMDNNPFADEPNKTRHTKKESFTEEVEVDSLA